MKYENCVTQGTIISVLQNERARGKRESRSVCVLVLLWRAGECISTGRISLHKLMIMGIHNGASEVCGWRRYFLIISSIPFFLLLF